MANSDRYISSHGTDSRFQSTQELNTLSMKGILCCVRDILHCFAAPTEEQKYDDGRKHRDRT